MADKNWQSYEEVAAHLLDRFATEFGLGRVEGKQVVPGASGTSWEIDAKGYAEDGTSFLIVECKRYTTSKVKQEVMAGMAFRINDTGAAGGIIVTPLGYQEGAKKVAAHAGIKTVQLRENSTTTDYVLRFLNSLHVGFSASIRLESELKIEKRDAAGNVVETRVIKG